jgi:hypothetical protein
LIRCSRLATGIAEVSSTDSVEAKASEVISDVILDVKYSYYFDSLLIVIG